MLKPSIADSSPVQILLPDLLRLYQGALGIKLRRGLIQAAQSGQYLSRFKGRGMEFDETRLYTPGDDIRCMDWKVTARTGKAHTKLFREERERPVFLSVDMRQSMFFATRGVFKSVLAARLAALLAWSALKQSDRVGGQIFSESAGLELKPEHGRRAVLHFLQKLVDAKPDKGSADSGLDEALQRLCIHARPGSLVFIFSDFRGLSSTGEFSLIRLRRHCDLALVFISDSLEKQLPSEGVYCFSDGEHELVWEASADAAKVHAERYAQRFARIEALAKQHHIRFMPCNTLDDPLKILQTVF